MFDQNLENYRALVEFAVNEHRKAAHPSLPALRIRLEPGQVRTRVVIEDVTGNHGSVYSFVDHATGDIFKPESWKRPAKGVRGSIYGDDPLRNHGPYGPAYLTGGSRLFTDLEKSTAYRLLYRRLQEEEDAAAAQ